jgi:hypothetical protein
MKLKIMNYIALYMLTLSGLAAADSWRCAGSPGRSFESREAASYLCGDRAYFTISADASAQHQSSLSIGGQPRVMYSERSHAQQQLVPVERQGSAGPLYPYTGNFPYAGISDYGDFSAGAGFGDW